MFLNRDTKHDNKILADTKKFTDFNVGGHDSWFCHLDGVAQQLRH